MMEPFSRIQHSGLIKKAKEERLYPVAEWARSFKKEHGRLPTETEIRACCQARFSENRITIYDDRPDWLAEWGEPGTDFMIVTSVAEWNLHYCSWNEKTIEHWTD